MTELLWRVSGPTGQAPPDPYSSALSPQDWEGPLGPGVWRSTAVSLHHNPPGVIKKRNVCPTGQISFRFHDPDLHLTPLFLSFRSKTRFLSLPWLALPPSQSVSKYVVTSLNLFPSFIFTFFVWVFLFKILGCWWFLLCSRRGALS